MTEAGAADPVACWRDQLLAGASLEVTARDADAPRVLQGRLPRGARVHVTYLANSAYAETVAQAKALAEAGFDPVPHVAARSLRSHAELDEYLARLVGEAGVSRVLLVAGDVPSPRGPFAASLDVLRMDALQAHEIRSVALAAHVEGHPVVAADVMTQALDDKLAYAAANGLEAEIITQFCFEAAPIVEFIARLRAKGVTAPVRIGAAAPTNAARLMSFALRCGVGQSVRALKSAPARLGRLMQVAGPEPLIEDLALRLPSISAGAVIGMHFFVFGGVEQAAAWASKTFAPR